MASNDLILCIDIGGTSVKAAQFSTPADGSLVLEQFAYIEIAGDDSEDTGPEATLSALAEVLTTNDFKAKDVYISVSGRSSFTQFVKVPSMTSDRNKIKEIIAFEAKQTIPFPIDEVVWDSQLIDPLENAEGNEIDAMLVIIKNEDAVRIIEAVENLGYTVKILEVAPTASYNAARANLVGNNQCEMILNIGGRCSSLIFVDGGRFFVRTIPIAGNTITAQIAKEFNIPFTEAEEMKRRHGFVALGGAYEEPESEVAATVSKIVRNVMTRLHAEINRSINVYRASQRGNKPEKLYLAGGSSILPFTPRFFSEKLRVPVEYFNPFQIVTLGPDIDQNMLREVAHLFSELVGLSLRHLGNPPISISLIPEVIRKQHSFQMKRPFFYASAIALLVFLGITCWALNIQYDAIKAKQNTFSKVVAQKRQTDSDVTRANAAFVQAQADFDQVSQMMEHRENWIIFFDILQKKIAEKSGKVWFTRISIENKMLVPPNIDATPSRTVEEHINTQENDIFGMRRNLVDEKMSEASAKKDDASKEAAYLNLEGYIYCFDEGVTDRVTCSNTAIGLLDDTLRETKLFSGSLQYRQEASDPDSFNISKFRATIELQKSINSPEYTDILRQLASRANARKQMGE